MKHLRHDVVNCGRSIRTSSGLNTAPEPRHDYNGDMGIHLLLICSAWL